MRLLAKALVLAGGEGARLWPKSTSCLPKQFTPLLDGKSLFQCTMQRLSNFLDIEDIYVVTLDKYKHILKEQAPYLPQDHILLEPFGRDTAACIGLSAIFLMEKYRDPTLLTIPADQYVLNEEDYQHALLEAVAQAKKEDCVVTLGIKPNRPETGYGYIKRGEKWGSVYRVDYFVEKPDFSLAQEYVNDPSYFWNSGIFVWRASTVLNMIQRYMPSLFKSLKEIQKAIGSPHILTVIEEEYMKLEKKSIDYGVIERTDSIYLLPVSFPWDDMGSWDTFERILPTDENGNVVEGSFTSIDTKNCVIHSTEQHISTIGIENLIIVATSKAVLVCSKERAQEVKQLLQINNME